MVIPVQRLHIISGFIPETNIDIDANENLEWSCA